MSTDNMEIDDGYRPVPPRAKQKVAGKKKPVVKAAGRRVTPEVAAAEARSAPQVRRNNPRPPPRSEPARDISRENARIGAVVVTGHDGEVLTRRRIGTGDKFDVPKHEIPRGWDYQWNAVTVLNQNINDIIVQGDLQMHENGWRPVPASRHPGRWTPQGYEGAIVIDGLRLEERPMALSLEAKQEDEARAKTQVRDRTDALRMTQKALPGSEVARQRNAALNMGMRMEIDPALDIPRPTHELDTGQE